jgi:hypothetical protein
MANATEPMALKISSEDADPDSGGHAGEHAMVRFAIRWSRFHLDTALG